MKYSDRTQTIRAYKEKLKKLYENNNEQEDNEMNITFHKKNQQKEKKNQNIEVIEQENKQTDKDNIIIQQSTEIIEQKTEQTIQIIS